MKYSSVIDLERLKGLPLTLSPSITLVMVLWVSALKNTSNAQDLLFVYREFNNLSCQLSIYT